MIAEAAVDIVCCVREIQTCNEYLFVGHTEIKVDKIQGDPDLHA